MARIYPSTIPIHGSGRDRMTTPSPSAPGYLLVDVRQLQGRLQSYWSASPPRLLYRTSDTIVIVSRFNLKMPTITTLILTSLSKLKPLL